DEVVPLDERGELLHMLTARLDQFARRGMLRLRTRPRLQRIAAVQTSGQRSEGVLRRFQLAVGDVEQTIDRHRESLFELELLLELLSTEAERGAGPRGDIGFQVVDIRTERLRRLG